MNDEIAKLLSLWSLFALEVCSMEFEIADNGIGFIEGHTEHKGNGLKNMKQRASQLNGTLTITSKPGEGTNIKLQFRYT